MNYLFIIAITITIGCCKNHPVSSKENFVADTVLAEYQAWHGLSSHSYSPYDLSDTNVISQQIQKAKSMNIKGFVVDWYGPKDGAANDVDREFIDRVTAELIKQAETNGFLIALLYDEGTVFYAESKTDNYQSHVLSDLHYAERYFSSPAYLKIKYSPAVFIFPYDTVDRFIDWSSVRNNLSTKITLIDKDPNPNDLVHDNNFDGFYAWVQATEDKWDADGREWGERYLDWFYQTMNSESYSNKVKIGGVWPGFDDLVALWSKNRYMARQDSVTYYNTINLSKNNKANIVMIDTWNDFEEGTDIEFGVGMAVDMDDQYSQLLVRSTPLRVKWNPDKGEVVFQVYKNGNLIYDQKHSPGFFIALEPNTKYEFKIWPFGLPISKWVMIRRRDPIPDTSPIVVD